MLEAKIGAFTDLDRVFGVLVLNNKIDEEYDLVGYDQWFQAYALYSATWVRVNLLVASEEIAQDRLHGYPAFLKNRLATFTTSSVLTYDREMRCVRTGLDCFWGVTIVDSLRHLLVEKGRGSSSVRITDFRNDRNGKNSPDKKKKKKKKKQGTPTKLLGSKECFSVSKGEKCAFKNCHFSHVCPKCKKTEPHVWATC